MTEARSTDAATASFASSPQIRKRMQAQLIRGTSPELAVRRVLHRAGMRFRVDYRPDPALRRRADVVFTKARVAVFVDGCFWHNCPDHGSQPRVNQDYWEPKLARNAERDAETDAYLKEKGWTVIRIWEHEDPEEAASRVRRAVQVRRS